MKTDYTIRKIIAAILLLVFLLGTAPKQFLHDLVANHKDSFSLLSSDEGFPVTHISKSTINCHCENLVVESPFTGECQHIEIAGITTPSLLLFYYFNSYSIPHYSYFALRGPPATITRVS